MMTEEEWLEKYATPITQEQADAVVRILTRNPNAVAILNTAPVSEESPAD